MPEVLGWTITALSLLLVAVAGGYVALDRLTDRWLLGLAGAVEAALVAQLVVGLTVLDDRAAGASATVLVSYLFGTLLVLPVSAIWALGEPSRAGTAVWLVAGLVVPVLVLRIATVHAGV